MTSFFALSFHWTFELVSSVTRIANSISRFSSSEDIHPSISDLPRMSTVYCCNEYISESGFIDTGGTCCYGNCGFRVGSGVSTPVENI